VNNGALVESHEALANLRVAMWRFHFVAEEVSSDLGRQTEGAISEIEQSVQTQQRYVESLEVEASSSDDDNGGRDTSELEEARARLASLEAAQAEAEATVAEIDSELNEFRTLLDELIPRAAEFLRRKVDVLNEKAAVNLESEFTSEIRPNFSVSATHVRPAARTSDEPAQAESLVSVPLPDGFHWISLSDIDVANELTGVQSASDFKKVDYPTMRQGLESFLNKVVPALKSNRDKSLWELNSVFQKQDSAAGITYEHGLQRVFEAFFSQGDAIYLNRGRQDDHFKIINGRHRIKAALDAGWPAIPAKIKDLRQ